MKVKTFLTIIFPLTITLFDVGKEIQTTVVFKTSVVCISFPTSKNKMTQDQLIASATQDQKNPAFARPGLWWSSKVYYETTLKV